MTTSQIDVADELRDWARGMYPLEAAVELLVRGMRGRFALPGNPWIKRETGVRGSPEPRYWADLADIEDHIGALSSGERSFLLIVASIGADTPVGLGAAISLLDRAALELVLAGLAHAAGSHQHSEIIYNEAGQPTRFGRLDSLYPWPPQA